jgi:hypothetical protein
MWKEKGKMNKKCFIEENFCRQCGSNVVDVKEWAGQYFAFKNKNSLIH